MCNQHIYCRAEILVLECWFLYLSPGGQVVVFLLTWSYGDRGPAPQLQRDGGHGGVHRRGWPSLFWDTGLQRRQPQQQLGHCRSSVDVAGFWSVVGNFNSLFPRGFLYSLSSLKSHRYSLLVAFGPFYVVGGSAEICGLVLKGMETERDKSCPWRSLLLNFK